MKIVEVVFFSLIMIFISILSCLLWLTLVTATLPEISIVTENNESSSFDESSATQPEINTTENNEYPSFAQNSATFEANLYSAIKKSTDGNIVISPFSIQASGALMYAGAAGQTADEIMNGFHFSGSKSSKEEFHIILNKYATSPYVHMVNRIYLAEGVNFKPQFRQVASEYFLSETENLDFTQPNAAAENINNWIKNVTDEKITKVVDSAALSSDTKLLLVNAIHFKGGWKKPFEKKLTKKTTFWISENEKKEIKMMKVFREFKFKNSHVLNAYVLEMDYNNTDIAMMVILPKCRTGLANLEGRLGTVNLIELSQNLKPRDVIVQLPKFKVEFSTNLRDKLTEMGTDNMFSDKADFSHMVENERVKVDQIIHKAFIDVNEEGTEAAGVTTITMSAVMLRPRRRFHADHPFFFAIKSKTTVLFVGRYKG